MDQNDRNNCVQDNSSLLWTSMKPNSCFINFLRSVSSNNNIPHHIQSKDCEWLSFKRSRRDLQAKIGPGFSQIGPVQSRFYISVDWDSQSKWDYPTFLDSLRPTNFGPWIPARTKLWKFPTLTNCEFLVKCFTTSFCGSPRLKCDFLTIVHLRKSTYVIHILPWYRPILLEKVPKTKINLMMSCLVVNHD